MIVSKTKEIHLFLHGDINDRKNIEIINIFNIAGFAVFYYSFNKHKLFGYIPICSFKNIEEKEFNNELKSINNKIVVTDFISGNKKINYIDKNQELNNQINKLIVNYSDREVIKHFYNNISIIVLNYNNESVIYKCIDSLLKYNERYNYEIIVVDNQSSDGSYEKIIKNYKNEIKVYRNVKNGCSSGRNLGISKTEKKYIMFLDSDQWVLNQYWLDNYLEILFYNKVAAIGWAGGWFNNLGYAYRIFDDYPFRYMPPIGNYRKDIGYLGTGGFITERKLLNKLDGFDEYYDPTCYEDTDLSLKIKNECKIIVYCPYLGIEHKAHQTTKSGSDSHLKLIKEKGDYFINKWSKINPRLLKVIK